MSDETSSPLITPEISQGIAYGFVGLMSAGLIDETGEAYTLFKIKDKYVKIEGNELFLKYYRQINPNSVDPNWTMDSYMPVNTADVLDDLNIEQGKNMKRIVERAKVENISLDEYKLKYPDDGKILNQIDEIMADPKKGGVIKATKVVNIEELNLKNKWKGMVASPALAGIITAAMSLGTVGEINYDEVLLETGVAGAMEIGEYLLESSLIKLGDTLKKSGARTTTAVSRELQQTIAKQADDAIKAATKQLGGRAAKEMSEKIAKEVAEEVSEKIAKAAGKKIAVSTGKAVGSSLAKVGARTAAASSVAGPIGFAVSLAMTSIDIASIALDIADVCGMNKNELRQGDLDDVREMYVQRYKEFFKLMGHDYPLEIIPDLSSQKDKNDLALYMNEYLNECNLYIDKTNYDEMRNMEMKRRRRSKNLLTNSIIALYLSQDQINEDLELVALLAVYKKMRERQIRQQLSAPRPNTTVQIYRRPEFWIFGSVVIVVGLLAAYLIFS